MRLLDKSNSYGWISITLHWLSGISIVFIWFLGDSIQSYDEFLKSGQASATHIGLALAVYLLFVARIVWRLRSGHPWLSNQAKAAHIISSIMHYCMLLSLVVMLVTGPLLAWSSSIPLDLFGLFTIPSPIEPSMHMASVYRKTHGIAANVLILAAFVHMCGACKHLMFNDDETFIRMLVPKR